MSSDAPQKVTISTSRGDLVAELYPDAAPRTVANFLELVGQRFYDDLTFHRVVDDFMVQTGCPEGTGSGGPGYRIADEFNAHPHRTGTLSMANTGEANSGGSQFFICHRPLPHLDGKHTVFGQLVSGVDVLYRIVAGDTITRIEPVRT